MHGRQQQGTARSLRRVGLIITGAWLALASMQAACAATVVPFTLRRPEGPRSVWLATPTDTSHRPLAGPATSASSTVPARRPLVILLHGHGGSAAGLLGLHGHPSPLAAWLPLVDAQQLMLAVPQGLAGTDGKPGWNDCRLGAKGNPTSDDVAFLDALVDTMVSEQGVDPDRVFVVGMSNGGLMALRYAQQSAARLAGFAAISASAPEPSVCPEPPSQPVAALFIDGTADPIMPWQGGVMGHFRKGERGSVSGVAATVAYWLKVDGQPGPGDAVTLPHRWASDPTRAQQTTWPASQGHVPVRLIRIDGGGHVEPSITQREDATQLAHKGAQSADLETADAVWGFFAPLRRGAPN